MRWMEPKKGDIKIRNRFLLFPKKINGESRWLEKVKYKEVYQFSYKYQTMFWEETEWVDD